MTRFVLFSLCLLSSGAAQVTFTRYTPSVVLAFDQARGRMLAFGGINGDATWEWQTAGWVQRFPSVKPTPRFGPALEYHSASGRVVLFGGSSASGAALGDTWTWDGNTWAAASPAASPSPRANAMTADDVLRGRLVLFGGGSNTDTWEWDGSNWLLQQTPVPPPSKGDLAYHQARGETVFLSFEWNQGWWQNMNPAVSPSPRSGHAMVYDQARQQTLLFGGSATADTWTWNGTTWQQHTVTPSPGARSVAAMAYDSRRGRAVLFGGSGPGVTYDDTWEWDGSRWALVAPPLFPDLDAAMAYDEGRGLVVMFSSSAQTWEWNGTVWVQRLPATNPPPRSGYLGSQRLVYDGARQRTVLIIDAGRSGDMELWEWDGTDWTQRSAVQPLNWRVGFGAAYDATRGRFVVYGGYAGGSFSPFVDEMWEYGAVQAASWTALGAGCVGSAGLPLLTAAGAPWLGDAVPLVVSAVPGNNPVALGFGASSTVLGSIPLPFDLTGIGMPGCWLRGSADVILAMASTGGVATLTLNVPNNPGLLGGTFVPQAFLLDAPANTLGLTVSNAMVGQVGAR